MAQCQEPGCFEKLSGNLKFCRDHNPTAKKTKSELKQISKQEKANRAQMAKEDNERAQQAKRNERAQQAAREEERKKELLSTTVNEWNGAIAAAVNQVKQLRAASQNPGGINAGTNPGAATIPGGTENPIAFTLPQNNLGVTKAMVAQAVRFKLDISWSAGYKYRVPHAGYGDILIHGC